MLAMLALLAAAAVPAADPFTTHFLDHTLRVDVYHSGHATEEVVTLDRVLRQGVWAGSRRTLLDPFAHGAYEVALFDAESGARLYSRRFDSIFAEYRTTAAAAAGVRRTFAESALLPFPRRPVRFVFSAQGEGGARELLDATIDPAHWSVNDEGPDAGVTVLTSHGSGPPHQRLDLAILGEGYTAADAGKFRADLDRFTKLLLSQQPFARLADRLVVRGVLKPSQERGCDEPSRGIHRVTALGAAFDALGSERYLLTEDNRAVRDVAAAAPYDLALIMVNHERYGGGGIYRFYATFTSDNQWSAYVALHELGHALAGLADEYYTSSVAYSDFYPTGREPAEPNITALLDPKELKWRSLVAPGVAVPTAWEKEAYDAMDLAYQSQREALNAKIAAAMRAKAPAVEVEAMKEEAERLSAAHAKKVDVFLAGSRAAGVVGAFEGAGYASTGLYRPTVDCIMFSKGLKPFCAVCQAALEKVIAAYAD